MKLCLADELIRRGEPLLRDRIKPKGNPAPKPRGKNKTTKPTPDAEPCKLSAERLAQLGATVAPQSLADIEIPSPKLLVGGLA